jgi:hypothetical protein
MIRSIFRRQTIQSFTLMHNEIAKQTGLDDVPEIMIVYIEES